MAVVTDPFGTQWSVHRRWWRVWDFTNFADFDFGWIVLILAAPFVAMWPVWLLSKVLGAKWKIVIERSGAEVGSELVRGWRASDARITELVQEIAQGRRSGRIAL